jgi:HSP20 family protein
VTNERAGVRARAAEGHLKEDAMAFRNLVPWSRNQQLGATRGDAFEPFFTFHREMNRLFDDVFRSVGPLGRTGNALTEGQFGWPRVELSETDKAVTVSAELPGMSEKDVTVELANGVLTIRGEKKAERGDQGQVFTERYYGSFQRQIPLEAVNEDKAEAKFRDGVLTVILPKSEQPTENVKRIAISAN